MIDPVKLAEIQMDACYAATDQGRSATFRDTATALRLLSAYAEAAGAEVEELRLMRDGKGRSAELFDPRMTEGKYIALPVAVMRLERADELRPSTDAARAALVAAGIRVGGGE